MNYRFPESKFTTNTISQQCWHILTELWEVCKAGLRRDWQHMCVELYDMIHSAETLIRILAAKKGVEPIKARLMVLLKNKQRGYYRKPLLNCGVLVKPDDWEGKMMNFGQALEALKAGKRVSRTGWNGKGMWLVLSPGYKALPADQVWNDHNKQVAIDNGGVVDINPYITMKTADNKIQPGWLASQTDLLAEDWGIVE